MRKRYKNILHLFCWLYFVNGQGEYQGLSSWYSSATISSGGGGTLMNIPEADRLNPALLSYEKNQFIILDVIRYPAQINSKHLGWIIPKKTKTYSIHYRQVDYGQFDGFDEDGSPTRPYSSNDTWFNGSISSQSEIYSYGMSAGIFYSRLSGSESLVFTSTLGGMVLLEKERIKFGFALRNLGTAIKTYTNVKGLLPISAVLSVSKKLMYLPLKINFDAEFSKDNHPSLYLSGVFTFSRSFIQNESAYLKWGMSSDKFLQQTESGVTKDIITGTGLGFGFNTEKFTIETAGYFYNPGNWLFGVSVGIYR